LFVPNLKITAAETKSREIEILIYNNILDLNTNEMVVTLL